MALINVKVAEIKHEAEGIRSFRLAKSGIFKLPAYNAGAHIDVHCGEGIIRQYSLCGDPGDRRHYTIAVKQVEQSRGGSDLMHLAVKEGDKLEIGSPRNNFPLDESAAHTFLVAAGIGITPIIAMADRLQQLGRSFEVHYFSRGKEHTAFRNRLTSGHYAEWVKFYEGLSVHEIKHALTDTFISPDTAAQVYLCGPGPFMNTAVDIAQTKLPSESIKLERFAANPAMAGTPTAAFDIKLARSGKMLSIGADETILEVLDRNNIDAAFSCEQGVCGTCVTEIIEGKADHRDSFLTDKQKSAQTKMCLCVSRAEGELLVLDL